MQRHALVKDNHLFYPGGNCLGNRPDEADHAHSILPLQIYPEQPVCIIVIRQFLPAGGSRQHRRSNGTLQRACAGINPPGNFPCRPADHFLGIREKRTTGGQIFPQDIRNAHRTAVQLQAHQRDADYQVFDRFPGQLRLRSSQDFFHHHLFTSLPAGRAVQCISSIRSTSLIFPLAMARSGKEPLMAPERVPLISPFARSCGSTGI